MHWSLYIAHLQATQVLLAFVVWIADRKYSHALRRGAAYILEQHVSPEIRGWAMGHRSTNEYIRDYKSKTSTHDFQAIMHGVELRDVTVLSSMSLGLAEDAPMALSEAGEAKVQNSDIVLQQSSLLNKALETS